MTTRLVAGLILAASFTTGATALAAGDRWTHDDPRHQARHIARDVHRAVRDAWREARHEIRAVAREVVREVRRSTREWGGSGGRASDDWRGNDAERQADRERARAARDLARTRDRARGARDREREARAFRQVSPTDDPCARDVGGDRGRACEVRDTRLPSVTGPLSVDATPNGGIRVEGWDQPDVLVRAVVQAYAESDAEARQLLPRVQVTAGGNRVAAEGPDRADSGRRTGWSVSFRIWAPRATALALSARNGGITVRAMRGESRFSTENGGVTLDDMSGQVVGTTRNGGVHVRLSGARWEGAGLDVETTNGGVTLALPASYSAALEVHTVNGGIRTDLPITVQGRIDRELRTTLGSGGPLLKLRTVNGGVRINAL